MKVRFTILVFSFIAGCSWCHAQIFTVDTLQKTGSIDRRINVVILGDGFTQSELPRFDSTARKFMSFFLEYKPFDAYRNYFNFFAIRVPSNESGATNPGTAPDRYRAQPVETKDTYFGSSFGTNNIHRYVVMTKRSAFTNVMARNFPAYDLAVLIVNSPWYGGSGGSPATFTLSEAANRVGVHEIGHLFSSLADEYWAGPAERANMTGNKDPANVRWKNWLDRSDIGIFQHSGDVSAANWYKPSNHSCTMERSDKPFCAVCREATANRIMELVKPVETILPPPESRVVVSAPTQFQLGLLLPEPNTLRIEWRLNDVPLDHKAPQISISDSQLVQRVSVLSVSVLDTTGYIRLVGHPRQHTYMYSWTLERANSEAYFKVLNSESTVCSGQSVTLSTRNCEGAITWSTGSTDTTISVFPTQSTTYSAVCVTKNAPDQTEKVDITVSPLPAVEAGNTGPYLEGQIVQLTSNGGVSYVWTGPDNFSSVEKYPYIPAANSGMAGTYTLTVTSAEGCVNSAQTTVEVSPILAAANTADEAVRVFPNPVKGWVQIRSSLPGRQSIVLLDVDGREILRKSFDKVTEINTSRLPGKLYLYRIGNEQHSATGKLILLD